MKPIASPMPFLFFIFLFLLSFFDTASAYASPMPSTLIKASTPSVYYVAQNQKRYVFPTESTFRTWYSNFSSVQTVTDTELASLPIGGNVTLRPGTRLVKIITDPKVYAVARGSILRWISSEILAANLYGEQWAQAVDDIPDTFFINYQTGSPITSVLDYSSSTERLQATNVDTEIQTHRSSIGIVPPEISSTSSTTSSISVILVPLHQAKLRISHLTSKRGEKIVLTLDATPSAGLRSLDLFFDGAPVHSCEFTPCAVEVTVPISGSSTHTGIRGVASWITSETQVATHTLEISPGVSGITLHVTKPEVRPNTAREFIVDLDRQFLARTTDIYVDRERIGGCGEVQQCRVTDVERSATGTSHSVYALVTNTNQFEQRSETQTFTVVDNDHPRLAITIGKSPILRGETVDVTIRADDDDLVDWTELWIDGSRAMKCSTSVCTAVIGPWINARTINIQARAQDARGLLGTATSTALTIY